VTEEVWSWWKTGSVHRAPWPTVAELSEISAPDAEALAAMTLAIEVLSEVRKHKSAAKLPMKAQISKAIIADTPDRLARLRLVQADVSAAAGIQVLDVTVADTFGMGVHFAESAPLPETEA
jgi:valyl-tRNA synthetase